MCNPKTTNENYNTQAPSSLEVKDKKSPSKQNLAPTFKPYDNRQIQMLFDIEELIPEHHLARVVDEMVEAIPDEKLFAYYSGGGRSSYHPKMMLKVLLYSYSQKVYSCRRMEQWAQAFWLSK